MDSTIKTEILNMSFGTALSCLRNGMWVRRPNMKDSRLFAIRNTELNEITGIGVATAGELDKAYTPTIPDILANDWMIVNE